MRIGHKRKLATVERKLEEIETEQQRLGIMVDMLQKELEIPPEGHRNIETETEEPARRRDTGDLKPETRTVRL